MTAEQELEEFEFDRAVEIVSIIYSLDKDNVYAKLVGLRRRSVIVEALLRCGASCHDAGVEFAKLIELIWVMSDATNYSGAIIGNTIKQLVIRNH
jgi:hypothetical protein